MHLLFSITWLQTALRMSAGVLTGPLHVCLCQVQEPSHVTQSTILYRTPLTLCLNWIGPIYVLCEIQYQTIQIHALTIQKNLPCGTCFCSRVHRSYLSLTFSPDSQTKGSTAQAELQPSKTQLDDLSTPLRGIQFHVTISKGLEPHRQRGNQLIWKAKNLEIQGMLQAPKFICRAKQNVLLRVRMRL